MRIFLAGASGVIGIRLLPLLVQAGHQVAAMTRTPARLDALRAAGAMPIVCDLFDAGTFSARVREFAPDLLMHQATDLPDDRARLPEFRSRNNRVRGEGTRNVVDAAREVAARVLAQSIAWNIGPAIEAHEHLVLEAGGTVIRYGQFYGPGTYYAGAPPDGPGIHVDEAARRTLRYLDGPAGIVTIADAGDAVSLQPVAAAPQRD
jgi:nucleoside-diphosphate-sugar epimerase